MKNYKFTCYVNKKMTAKLTQLMRIDSGKVTTIQRMLDDGKFASKRTFKNQRTGGTSYALNYAHDENVFIDIPMYLWNRIQFKTSPEPHNEPARTYDPNISNIFKLGKTGLSG